MWEGPGGLDGCRAIQPGGWLGYSISIKYPTENKERQRSPMTMPQKNMDEKNIQKCPFCRHDWVWDKNILA